MIKVFSATDRNFNSNGDAVINPLKARVKCVDNGDFYIDLECPTSDAEYLQPNNIIVAPTPDGEEAFRIRQVEKTGNKYTVKAWALYYDSDNLLIADSYAVNMTCEEALTHFNEATDSTSPFFMLSDIEDKKSDRCVRESLRECINDVMERWGGHLYRHNWTIGVFSELGEDKGLSIEYKNNLQELKASYDWKDVCTKVLPVGKDGQLLDELYISSTNQYSIPFTKTVSFDQNINEDGFPNHTAYINALKADLRQQATAWVNANSVPQVNYNLKCVGLEGVSIGDTIEVKDKRINIDLLTQVISYQYNCLTKHFDSLEFGNFKPVLTDLLTTVNKNTDAQIKSATSGLNAEIDNVAQEVTTKQNILTAGDNVTILNDVISADFPTFEGATASAEGTRGLVPAPTTTGLYLSSGGTWEAVEGYTAGDGIKIQNKAISLESYAQNELVQFVGLNACAVYDNGLTFALDLPRPNFNYRFSVYALDFTIYNGNNQSFNVVSSGTVQSTFTVNVENHGTNKVKLTVTDSGTNFSNLTTQGYIIQFNAILLRL